MRPRTVLGLVVLGWGLACGGAPTSSSPSNGAPQAGGGRHGKHKAGGQRGGGAASPAPAAGGGGQVYCEAAGVYTTCTDQGNGFEQCVDQESDGSGIGSTQAEAGTAAIEMCTEHMTNMIITANIDGSGSVKSSCVVTGCR